MERERRRDSEEKMPMETIDERWDRFREAYLMMAKFYRPCAPSDGMGNIMLSAEEMKNRQRLQREAGEFAQHYLQMDDDCVFKVIGCTHFEFNRAFVFALEAAHLMCSGVFGRKPAVQLLKLAIKEMEDE